MAVILILVTFILCVLVIVWSHYLSRRPVVSADDKQVRENTNVELYHEHKKEIEEDFQLGKIDEESYHYLLTELDKGLLQDISENSTAKKNNNTEFGMSIGWPISISAFVLIVSFVLYNKIGAFERLSQPRVDPQAQQMQASAGHQAQVAQLQQLAQQTQADPDNSELWYSYGQALIGMGQFEKAVAAFDQVIRIEGTHADLLGAKAQATYYQSGQQITPQVQNLIDQALALDPLDASTNILLGMHAFSQQDYQQSVNYWQKVINSDRGNVNVPALTQAVNEAKSRLALASGNMTTQAPATPAPAQPADANSPQLTLKVSISDALKEKLIDVQNKVVFVYAVPNNGMRMPVAAVKISVTDLPTTIVLNNERAMNPEMNLSSVENVNIFAVISMQGTPGIKPGDLKAEITNVATSVREPLSLEINTIVP